MIPAQFEDEQYFLSDHGTYLRVVIIPLSDPAKDEQVYLESFDATKEERFNDIDPNNLPDNLPQFDIGLWTIKIQTFPNNDVLQHIFHQGIPVDSVTQENTDDDHIVMIAKHNETP